jgi:ABC-type microcin C transport system permease subunit YejE
MQEYLQAAFMTLRVLVAVIIILVLLIFINW